MARQAKLPFPTKSTVSTTSSFDLLHMYLRGPYHVPTHNNYKYFLTIVDDFSRSIWTHLLSSKSNTLQTIKSFISLVENQFKNTVKSIRTDNGAEFINNETNIYLQIKGIIHQRIYPYTSQQNGVVERKHKHLLEVARALLYQSKLPTTYWGECILTVTYLINRLPNSVLDNKTPFGKLHHICPSYSHLRSFGCLCFSTLRTYKNELDPRSTPHIFVGYPCNTKRYKVLDLSTKKIHVSRDVTFQENIFPFALSESDSSFSAIWEIYISKHVEIYY